MLRSRRLRSRVLVAGVGMLTAVLSPGVADGSNRGSLYGGPRAGPFGAGVRSPAQLFLTVHGATAVLTDAGSGAEITPAPTVRVSMLRRQFEVFVPHAAWNPGTSVVRMEAGVGLWDPTGGQYLKPGP